MTPRAKPIFEIRDIDVAERDQTERRGGPARSGSDVLSPVGGAADTAATSVNGVHFEFTLRVESAGISHLYANVRKALVSTGYHLTETVDVMRVLERLIATSIDRNSKRLQVRVHALPKRTYIRVIDRRQLNRRVSVLFKIVPRELARKSGSRPVRGGAGLVLWAIVDRRPGSDVPPSV